MTHAPSHLPRDFAISITLLTAFACLYPFSGWRTTGVGPFDYLSAPWPRYFTWTDIWLNVLGFIPIGFAWATWARQKFRPGRTLLGVWLAGTLLSFAVETTQNYLPTRVASNIDLATNSIGSLIGAACGLRWGRIFEPGGILPRWRERLFLPGRSGSSAILLITLWWFSLLNPSSYLFANGDLHAVFRSVPVIQLGGGNFLHIETLLTAANTLVIGLFAQHAMRRPRLWLPLVILLLGLSVKTLATTAFLAPPQPWHWATPGGLFGLAAGVGLLVLCWMLPMALRLSIASLALLAATALVNLAPDNPYWEAGTKLAREGHVLNFHGATEVMAGFWPFLALLWLSLARPAPPSRPAVEIID
ncbi:MAG: VanZ family protein [Betaproteobacteria bacterium]|nr:VanZ family protein [Betaproteobacteria bacterium]